MAKLLASHNAIVHNKFNGNSYLLGNDGVWQIVDHTNQCGNPEISHVWTAPDTQETKQPRYTASLTFPSIDKAIYSNGAGQFFILDTRNQPWSSLHCSNLLGAGRPFVVASSILSADENCLHIISHSIEHSDESQSKPCNAVEWLTLDAASFEPLRNRRYAFSGEIDHLDVTDSGMHFVGDDKRFTLTYDSNEPGPAEKPQDDPKDEPPKFFWMQGVEDIVIWLRLPININKREIKVTFKPSYMSILIRNERKLDGKLWGVIDSDSLTWTIDAGKKLLEVTMSKANTGLIWQRFLQDASLDGEEVNSPEMVTMILADEEDSNANSVPKAAYNTQELEECDGNDEKSRVYLHFSNAKGTQKVNVSDRQLLFYGHGSVCLRHDVDGLVWQFKSNDKGEFSFEHVDTFDALGYVQASKTQRRYTLCSPKRSYVAIIDCSRHVYIYKKPEAISQECELRNRKSGRNVQRIAKQYVWTFGQTSDDSHVVGALAKENVLMVATTRNIYCLKID